LSDCLDCFPPALFPSPAHYCWRLLLPTLTLFLIYGVFELLRVERIKSGPSYCGGVSLLTPFLLPFIDVAALAFRTMTFGITHSAPFNPAGTLILAPLSPLVPLPLLLFLLSLDSPPINTLRTDADQVRLFLDFCLLVVEFFRHNNGLAGTFSTGAQALFSFIPPLLFPSSPALIGLSIFLPFRARTSLSSRLPF